MTNENQVYIDTLNIYDIPWHRLTTAYGRGTDFPAHLETLMQMNDPEQVGRALHELTANMEHQGTLWHATPFGMIFLSRILEKALLESGQNAVAYYMAGELLEFFIGILQCYHDGNKIQHAAPLSHFSDLLKEEYLWSEEYDEEEDAMRYEEEEVFPDNLFYSFYYYSWQAVSAYRSSFERSAPKEFAPEIAELTEKMKPIIKEIEVKGIFTKSNLPVSDYSVNPYVGCTHSCKYCYASFMKRFTKHTEAWGDFLDVKYWQRVKNPAKYVGKSFFLGSVTDPYCPEEEIYRRTRALLEQLQGFDIKLSIQTKSDLILRDMDLIGSFPDVRVGFSINTLDEEFKEDMDRAVSIERRLVEMKTLHDAGIRTNCFISPIFPEITDVKAIIDGVFYKRSYSNIE